MSPPKKTKVQETDLEELGIAPASPVEPPPVMLSPFDSLGKVRDLSGAADVALVEQMPEYQKDILFRMLADAREAEACETKLADLRTAVVKAMHVETLAIEANNKNNPVLTHTELMAQVRHAHDLATMPKPEGRRPVNPKPAAELKAAQENLIRLRQEMAQAQLDFAKHSRARADAIGAYMRTMPVIDDQSNRRAHIDGAAQQRLGLATGTIQPPKAPAEPTHVWPIEAGYRARKLAPKKVPFVGSRQATAPLSLKYGSGAPRDPKRKH